MSFEGPNLNPLENDSNEPEEKEIADFWQNFDNETHRLREEAEKIERPKREAIVRHLLDLEKSSKQGGQEMTERTKGALDYLRYSPEGKKFFDIKTLENDRESSES